MACSSSSSTSEVQNNGDFIILQSNQLDDNGEYLCVNLAREAARYSKTLKSIVFDFAELAVVKNSTKAQENERKPIELDIDYNSLKTIKEYLLHKALYQPSDVPTKDIPEFPLPDDPEELKNLLMAAHFLEC